MCFRHITKAGRRWLSAKATYKKASAGRACGEGASRLRHGKDFVHETTKGKKSKTCAAEYKRKDNDVYVVFVNHVCEFYGNDCNFIRSYNLI